MPGVKKIRVEGKKKYSVGQTWEKLVLPGDRKPACRVMNNTIYFPMYTFTYRDIYTPISHPSKSGAS